MIIALTGPVRYSAMYAALQEALTICGGHGVFGLASASRLAYTEDDRKLLIQSRQERIRACDVLIDVEMDSGVGGQAQLDCAYAASLGKPTLHLFHDQEAIQALFGASASAARYFRRIWGLRPSPKGAWGMELTCVDPRGLGTILLDPSTPPAPMHIVEAHQRRSSFVPQAQEATTLGWLAQTGAGVCFTGGLLAAVDSHTNYARQCRRAPLMTGHDYVVLVRPYRESTYAGLPEAVRDLDDAEWDFYKAAFSAGARNGVEHDPKNAQRFLSTMHRYGGQEDSELHRYEGYESPGSGKFVYTFHELMDHAPHQTVKPVGTVRAVLFGGTSNWAGLTFELAHVAQRLAAKHDLVSTRPNKLVVELAKLSLCLGELAP